MIKLNKNKRKRKNFMNINNVAYVAELIKRFKTMAHLVTEDLIRHWFIETQNLKPNDTVIEKPHRELLSKQSQYYSEINSRARADLYYYGENEEEWL